MAKLTYKDMNIQDIIKWCQANGQVEWLKEKASDKVACKVYPRIKTVNEEGKTVSVADKSQKPKTEMRPISFIQIKNDFCEEFMPELLPKKKDKAPNMYDLIKNL